MKYLIWIPIIGVFIPQLDYNYGKKRSEELFTTGLIPLWGAYHIIFEFIILITLGIVFG